MNPDNSFASYLRSSAASNVLDVRGIISAPSLACRGELHLAILEGAPDPRLKPTAAR